MSWKDDPATEKQLAYLRQFGYEPNGPITKGEASQLIDQFSEDPARDAIRTSNQIRESDRLDHEAEKKFAYVLHRLVNELTESLTTAERDEKGDIKWELNDTRQRRLQFWKDTMRSPEKVEDFHVQANDLFESRGHHFKMPSKAQLEAMLEALDASSPTWDLEMPEYFFTTLEHNFPELKRRM
jgi:hypothetical protein